MPAYLIANVDVTDADGYRAYSEQVGATIAAHGGRYLARGGTTEVLEGEWEPKRLVVLEFPTIDCARAWYHSAAYQQLKPHRLENARSQLVLIEGFEPMAAQDRAAR